VLGSKAVVSFPGEKETAIMVNGAFRILSDDLDCDPIRDSSVAFQSDLVFVKR
jgi:hypothetical protein